MLPWLFEELGVFILLAGAFLIGFMTHVWLSP